MNVSKTENRFKTGFQQPKTGFPKKSGFNIPITVHAQKCGISCLKSAQRSNRTGKTLEMVQHEELFSNSNDTREVQLMQSTVHR